MTRSFALLLLAGCVDAGAGLGEMCSRNSHCDSPLVCRLQACRNECASSRDCSVGSICLRDESGSGSCRLPREATCSTAGDCPTTTECIDGACTNACVVDSDCAPGTACLDGEEPCAGGECGCRVLGQVCIVDRDCSPGVCVMGVCAEECRTTRDCRFGSSCEGGRCVTGDAGPRSDAAIVDAPPTDSMATPSFSGVEQMAAGRSHTCAVSAGSLHCWGSLPPFGSNPADGTLHPVCTPRAAGVDAVESSGTHYCARTGTSLFCAGQNNAGLGDGVSTESFDLVAVPTLTNVSDFDVAAGNGPAGHSCAIEGGEVYCWGLNFDGQLGNGTTTPSPTPVSTGFVDAVQVVAGFSGTCAINTDRELWCWGNGVPVPASGATVPTLIPTVRASHVDLSNGLAGLSDLWGCFVDDATMAVSCWTYDSPASALGITATQMAVAGTFTCALQLDTTVSCWGTNGFGQAGSGSLEPMVPMGSRVIDRSRTILSGVGEIVAGWNHACARIDDSMWCWGGNGFGQLGGYGRVPSNVAVQVRCVR